MDEQVRKRLLDEVDYWLDYYDEMVLQVTGFPTRPGCGCNLLRLQATVLQRLNTLDKLLEEGEKEFVAVEPKEFELPKKQVFQVKRYVPGKPCELVELK